MEWSISCVIMIYHLCFGREWNQLDRGRNSRHKRLKSIDYHLSQDFVRSVSKIDRSKLIHKLWVIHFGNQANIYLVNGDNLIQRIPKLLHTLEERWMDNLPWVLIETHWKAIWPRGFPRAHVKQSRLNLIVIKESLKSLNLLLQEKRKRVPSRIFTMHQIIFIEMLLILGIYHFMNYITIVHSIPIFIMQDKNVFLLSTLNGFQVIISCFMVTIIKPFSPWSLEPSNFHLLQNHVKLILKPSLKLMKKRFSMTLIQTPLSTT